MKKFIMFVIATLVAMVSMSNFAMAQWQVPNYHEADEVKGIDAYYTNGYIGENGYFISNSTETFVQICVNDAFFKRDFKDGFVKVEIGFYEGDKMVEKVSTDCLVPNNREDIAIILGYGAKVINHIKNNGKVRFIAPIFNNEGDKLNEDFDLTVPMNKDLKTKGDRNLVFASAEEVIRLIKLTEKKH